ncbi:MAG: hypothetical protein J6A28_02220 [Clostridia bacterium]|nr:hypothetical protein [Clostridia bacterium]
MDAKKVELQQYDNYHYVLVGFTTFDEVIKKLKKILPFWRISPAGKKYIKEIFYDNEYNMLSDAGIVLSKSTTNKNTYFNIRRLVRVLNRKNKKYQIDSRCDEKDHPREFAEQIAAAINNSFSSSLTIDLENLVKKTKPKIQIDIYKKNYQLVCGTGYNAMIVYENVFYKDLESGRKVVQDGVSLSVPKGDSEETAELLKIIERNIPGLVLYEESRFEIAQKLLYTDKENEDKE